jgi:seryl-tRNA synthetase
MTISETGDLLTAQRRAFHEGLIEHEWLLPARAAMLFGLGPKSVAVYDGLVALIAITARDIFAAEITPVRFPPIFAVGILERTGYVASFPQLLGTINSFLGGPSEHRELIAGYDRGGDWQAMLDTTGLALVSAACHPLFAHLEGSTADAGKLYELTGECFRHEPSEDPMRLMSFRQREYVRLGTEIQAKEHRRQWLEIAQQLFAQLQLPVDVVPANDAFFGRGGAMLAANQLETEAKFEIVTEVYEGTQTAISSTNFHGDHFGHDFAIVLEDGSVAQSACIGFGMERVVLALANRHGLELDEWPADVLKVLGIRK